MAKVKATLCVGLSALLMSGSVWAQNPTKYIKWNGENEKFHTSYAAWAKGQPLYPGAAEDENFFISRVKIKDRFTNRNTQANPNVTNDNEKKLINWVPIGTTANGNPNALPSGIFDSDVFSMWNMITHYGNWTAPLVRVPAAFTDVAHKNGVSVSALGSVPFGASLTPSSEPHGANLAALYGGGAEKFINFLKYYGVDGWGLNSEFTATATMSALLKGFMGDAFAYAEANGLPTYSVAWYTLVNNNLSLSFADGLTANNKDWFHYNGRKMTNYYFGNYNWDANKLQTNQDVATSVGRDPFDVYAGMNLQGAEGNRWLTLKDYKTSIGLWGAHDMNMFFNNRNENGGSPEAQQATYLLRNELFFTNGVQNPAKQLTVQNLLNTSASALKGRFHGISAFISAKSVLQWSLDDAPFYSFFNMGNGKFFNIQGEKKYNGEWYNISMQDYLPTWRYWFASSYLGRQVAENGLKATFTWEDAWFGGSSLEITGTNANDEFLHLFKTKFGLKQGDKIKITFKVVNGSADIKLVGSAVGSEATSVSTNLLAAADIDLDEWVTKEITVGAGFRDFRLADKELAAIALQFSNANDLKLRIGAFSISRGAVQTPSVPMITNQYTKAYAYTYKGIDAKVVFSMPTPAGMPADARLYNDDVKTAFFKIYTRQVDGEVNFVGATTSWAALVFGAPFDTQGIKKIQIGVSAVGLDGVTESEIAWSALKDAGAEEISNEIVINKPVIKPGENFTAGYADPNHGEATWTILDQNGATVGTHTGKTFTTSINQIGIYNLKVSYNGQEETRAGFIQISGSAVGAMPEILTLTFNGSNANSVDANKGQVNNLAYTGRSADGTASRGINLDEKPFGAKAADIGFDNTLKSSFTLAFWVKVKSLAGATQFFQLRNPARQWPSNNWGHIRTVYYPDLKIIEVFRRISLAQGATELTQQYEMNVVPGAWMHIAYVFTAKNGGLQGNLYINGAPAKAVKYRHSGREYQGYSDLGFATTDSEANNMFLIGGPVANGVAGINGVLDDVKFFKSALTPEQVKAEMNQGTPTTAGAHGFWDFENEPVDNAYLSRINNNLPMKLGELQAGSGEGVNNFVGRASAVDAGSPFVPGTSFRVETKPSWTFSKGSLSGSTGNDTAGSASVTYNKAGTFTGTLTLTNSWGSDSKTIEVINIAEPQGVEMTDALSLQAFPNPFAERVNIRFATAGAYELAVYDLAGNFVSKYNVSAEAGDIVAFNLNTAPGTYLLRVKTDGGKLLQTLKLQSK